MKTPSILVGPLVAVAVASSVWADPVVFSDVKTRFNRSAGDRRLVDKDARLILDDQASQLVVDNLDRRLDVRYQDVRRVVFDVSTHMRGGALSGLMVVAVSPIAGAVIAGQNVRDYWCYIEYTRSDGTVGNYMLEVAQESSAALIDHMKRVFEDRVVVAEFPEKPDDVEKGTLLDLQSKHDLKVDKRNHPMPELRPDKALVVVVCPPLAARDSGKGNQQKLHANDQVVLVNKMGTYGFAYLDPGDYRLVSQSGNARGFSIALEAGKDYYFLQDTFQVGGLFKGRTALSRHSKELVMYELSGAYHADWKRE